MPIHSETSDTNSDSSGDVLGPVVRRYAAGDRKVGHPLSFAGGVLTAAPLVRSHFFSVKDRCGVPQPAFIVVCRNPPDEGLDGRGTLHKLKKTVFCRIL